MLEKPAEKLPRYAVGIDVETTSLEPATGDIIDVAAIRYDLITGQEVDRVTFLTKPRQPLSHEIIALTGIQPEMVADAPPFSEVRERVAAFIGRDVVFAHNAVFDVGYLAHHGLPLTNLVWDTFLLSTVAWPAMASYNLGFLAQELSLELTAEHRAAADVESSWQLLRRCQEQLVGTKEHIAQVEAILRKGQVGHYSSLFSVQQAPAKPEQEKSSDLPEDAKITDALDSSVSTAALFAPQGPLSALPGYELRGEQTQMATTTAQWIDEGGVGLIEAGTGVGKTFAYLAAALEHLPLQKRVLIATYTKQLQDQLVQHDIPKLLGLINRTTAVAVLKGRQNYLCATRFALVQKRAAFSHTEAFLLIKILQWLAQGGSGDLEQINISHQAYGLLRQLHADSPVCRATCGRQTESGCWYQVARRGARTASLVVVNHALLTKMSLGEEPSLQAPIVVIDEAHHLEEAARQASRIDLSSDRVSEVVEGLQQSIATHGPTAIAERAKAMRETLMVEDTAWRQSLVRWVEQHSESGRILLTPAVRKGTAWRRLHAEGEAWRSQLKFLLGFARSIKQSVGSDQLPTYAETLREAERLALEVQNFLEGSSERIQWIAVEEAYGTSEKRVQLHDVALSIAAVLTPLFTMAKATILTSATLSTNGNFDYIKKMLGLTNAKTVALGTPYNLREQMLLYLVDDGPTPMSSQFEPFLKNIILQIATLLRGRTLVLFTAKAAIKRMHTMLIQQLNREKIRLFSQNVTGGRRNMLERFKIMEESVLLGTASFWEGIDVPGESLSCVIIPKLPFAAPDDPVITALAEALRVNSFRDIAVPRMLITLRQGIGRLLRTARDRGVVILMDPRLHHTEYGQAVLKNLPPATTHIGGATDVIPTIENWFGSTTLERWKKI